MRYWIMFLIMTLSMNVQAQEKPFYLERFCTGFAEMTLATYTLASGGQTYYESMRNMRENPPPEGSEELVRASMRIGYKFFEEGRSATDVHTATYKACLIRYKDEFKSTKG